MTIKQPRIAGPQPSLRDLAPSDSDCTIAIQALCHGPLDTKVTAVSGAAARPGRAVSTSRCASAASCCSWRTGQRSKH